MIPIVFDFIYEKLSYLSSFLTPYLSWYGIVAVLAFIYIMVYSLVMYFFKKELIKRKLIMKELQDFRENNPVDEETGRMLSKEEYMKTILQRKQTVLPDEHYDKMWGIVEMNKPKPFVILISMTSQVLLAAVFFAFLSQVDVLSYHLPHYLIAMVLMTILLAKNDKIFLRIALLVFVAFVYWRFTSAALLFATLISLYRLIIKFTKK
jgi:hypothetical protein